MRNTKGLARNPLDESIGPPKPLFYLIGTRVRGLRYGSRSLGTVIGVADNGPCCVLWDSVDTRGTDSLSPGRDIESIEGTPVGQRVRVMAPHSRHVGWTGFVSHVTLGPPIVCTVICSDGDSEDYSPCEVALADTIVGKSARIMTANYKPKAGTVSGITPEYPPQVMLRFPDGSTGRYDPDQVQLLQR
jgi:hypothetical protein